MAFTRKFLLTLAVLSQVLFAPTTDAVALPLFPGTPEVLCSLADFPWYVCNQSDNVAETAVPNFYDRLVQFFGGDAVNGDQQAAEPREEEGGFIARMVGFLGREEDAGEARVVEDGGVRKLLRSVESPNQV